MGDADQHHPLHALPRRSAGVDLAAPAPQQARHQDRRNDDEAVHPGPGRRQSGPQRADDVAALAPPVQEPGKGPAGTAVAHGHLDLEQPSAVAHGVDGHPDLQPEPLDAGQVAQERRPHGPLARQRRPHAAATGPLDPDRGQAPDGAEATRRPARQDADDQVGLVGEERPEQPIGRRCGRADVGIDQQEDVGIRARLHAGEHRRALPDVVREPQHGRARSPGLGCGRIDRAVVDDEHIVDLVQTAYRLDRCANRALGILGGDHPHDPHHADHRCDRPAVYVARWVARSLPTGPTSAPGTGRSS